VRVCQYINILRKLSIQTNLLLTWTSCRKTSFSSQTSFIHVPVFYCKQLPLPIPNKVAFVMFLCYIINPLSNILSTILHFKVFNFKSNQQRNLCEQIFPTWACREWVDTVCKLFRENWTVNQIPITSRDINTTISVFFFFGTWNQLQSTRTWNQIHKFPGSQLINVVVSISWKKNLTHR